jgi:hypothetical protein
LDCLIFPSPALRKAQLWSDATPYEIDNSLAIEEFFIFTPAKED